MDDSTSCGVVCLVCSLYYIRKTVGLLYAIFFVGGMLASLFLVGALLVGLSGQHLAKYPRRELRIRVGIVLLYHTRANPSRDTSNDAK